jgi:hypothetical protein
MLSLLFGCLAWVARFALGQLSTFGPLSRQKRTWMALASNSTSPPRSKKSLACHSRLSAMRPLRKSGHPPRRAGARKLLGLGHSISRNAALYSQLSVP